MCAHAPPPAPHAPLPHTPTCVLRRAVVAPRHVFGIKADVRDNTSYFDEQTVLYAAGNNVVIFNSEQKSQKFIPATEKSEGITALAVSPNRKYVAVAERAAEGEKAQVTVYDLHTLKRRKVLQAVSADVSSREFVCIAFSPDSKGLLTHGGAPDWALVHWHWEKAKVGAVYKASGSQAAAVYQCSFNPIDNTVVGVTGDGICRFLRINEQALKPLPGAMGKREPQGYLCHAWMSEDRVIVATDAGDLLLLEAGELKSALTAAPADGASIDSIVAYSKGFVCGAGDIDAPHPDPRETPRQRDSLLVQRAQMAASSTSSRSPRTRTTTSA